MTQAMDTQLHWLAFFSFFFLKKKKILYMYVSLSSFSSSASESIPCLSIGSFFHGALHLTVMLILSVKFLAPAESKSYAFNHV